MKNIDSIGHLTGNSMFLDDIETGKTCIHAHVFHAEIAHGTILKLDVSEALEMPGVLKILTHEDIPGENQIGAVVSDEVLLAENEIHFFGQPIALVLAGNKREARLAAKKIRVEYEQLETVTDPRIARENGQLIIPPRTFQIGDLSKGWADCSYVIEGRADSGGQEHLYLETQGAYASIGERGKIIIQSSTQGPTAVQKMVSRVLAIPMQQVEVNVQRLGGAFGGKEDQATPWAVMAGLACKILNKPVKLVLDREEDLLMTGKRHPYSSDFKIGFDDQFKIMAFEAVYYQNAGAAADLSPAIIDRTLFHATGAYYIPNAKLTAYCCRTNLPPNTAFRGFGAPQAFFVIESALVKAAEKIGVDVSLLQQKNLIAEDQSFPYGQITEHARAIESWEQADLAFSFKQTRDRIDSYNEKMAWFKKGMAVMPICFGISFTNSVMNQARALIHIYSDGSVGISTAAVEMGQGVNTKMIQVAARTLCINPARIRIETTNTTRVANSSPTAASAAADLNGHAVRIACEQLTSNLLIMMSRKLEEDIEDLEIIHENLFVHGDRSAYNWQELIRLAIENRVQLSEIGHYATPNIFFNKSSGKGHPFAYHVYGTAICVMKLDCLRGRYEIESMKIVHDFGKSINYKIDLGQVHGAVLQGIGWLTLEELRFDHKGQLESNALSTYKIPDINFIPDKFEVRFLPNGKPNAAIFQSKAIGEPPLMYGVASYFALHDAIKAFNDKHRVVADAPLTPERVLMHLYT